MKFIRSILFNICFIAWTSLCCLFMVWSFAIPRPMMVKVITQYFKGLDPIEKYVIGLTYEVKGRENMLDTPCLIAIKHQSAWETFKLFQLFGDVAIVLKRELMFIPFWGWYQAKSGAIPVNRAAGGKAMNSLIAGAQKVIQKQKRSIVIFPQGTRVPVGEKRAYKVGIAALYENLNVPIVPVALNAGLFWPKNSFIKKPGKITVEILPAIPAGLSRPEAMKQLEEAIETASNRLVQEARARGEG